MKTAIKYHSALTYQKAEKAWYSPCVDREKYTFLYSLELQKFSDFLEGNMVAWFTAVLGLLPFSDLCSSKP